MTVVNERAWRDATGAVIADLNSVLTPTVYPSIPQDLPAQFVTVRRVGGGYDDQHQSLDRARMQVEVWSGVKDTPGQSLQPANALAATVIEALRNMPVTGSNGVQKVSDLAVAAFPDPDTQIPRVIITATVVVKPTDA